MGQPDKESKDAKASYYNKTEKGESTIVTLQLELLPLIQNRLRATAFLHNQEGAPAVTQSAMR